jgi:hypothetical protein
MQERNDHGKNLIDRFGYCKVSVQPEKCVGKAMFSHSFQRPDNFIQALLSCPPDRVHD